MNVPWDDVRLFLAIAETGSLTSAARRLKTSQPTISRRLAELEGQLREPVFTRRAEGARLTPFGERLLEPARRMAEWAAEVDRAADRAEARPRGTVRITAPPGVAADFVAPFAASLRERLPEVSLEVVSTTQYLDLSRREADLAIRLQRPPPRDLACLASVEYDVAAFATRAFIERLGPGYRFDDVGWITWAPPLDHLSPNPELGARIPGFRPVFASDDYLVQRSAAEAGLGAVFLACLRHRFSPPSALEEMALDVGPLRSALYLVAARAALDIPRVRAVADALGEELAAIVTWRRGQDPRAPADPAAVVPPRARAPRR